MQQTSHSLWTWKCKIRLFFSHGSQNVCDVLKGCRGHLFILSHCLKFVISKSIIALWSAFLHTSNIYYLNNLLACKYEGISFHCVNRCFLFMVINHYCLSKTFRCKSMKQTFTDRINITVTGLHFIPHK